MLSFKARALTRHRIVISEWGQADEEAFLDAFDAPSANSNAISSIATTWDLEQQVYLDETIFLANAYTKLKEVIVDPTNLKHSVQELFAGVVEYNKPILTIVKAKPSELAKLDLEISDLQEKREAFQKSLALDKTEM
ncbi:hypothetical protein ACFE04_031115 [Oxalis oulophora]